MPKRIKLYDGYHGKEIFKPERNNSVYYNQRQDKQVRLPLGSREKVLKELGLMPKKKV